MGFFALAMTACVQMPYEPQARQVKIQPKNGGIIAVPVNHRAEDKQKAISMMTDACGTKKPEVTEEAEVVVGQKTTTASDNYRNQSSSSSTIPGLVFGNPSSSSNSTSTTTAEKEWQMTFKCM